MSVTTAALLTALSAQWSAVAAVWINHRTVGPIVHGDLQAAAQRAADGVQSTSDSVPPLVAR